MRSRRVAPVIFFLILGGVLLGSGAAGARPSQDRPAAKVVPALAPASAWKHDGHHCRTRRDPVAPDPADL